ncbi:unnamed protein product [Rotaria socialis]|uniref:Uncharacterized protein n=1 Tax=Rotaria socialis TaxID=392032 RepID=A0A820F934_9BILA|nr:unnamed protein product [Rotaria socialis]CAF3329625.1 unnamed protein product [Rotaria socialis]CAF4257619.1 unnamed protein product [Rotaria socialis]CAF4955841.1 unnamed protein product [Rotaria socialis]
MIMMMRLHCSPYGWIKSIAPKSIFGYLYHGDCKPDGHEILFSLRTLFRIDKVKFVNCDEMWYVNMTVVDESNEEVQKVAAPWKASILKENNSSESENRSSIYVCDLSANNAVLRIETVDLIFKLRYFIQDRHNQLALMHVHYLKRL